MYLLELDSWRVVHQYELAGPPIDSNSLSPDGQWMAALRNADGTPTLQSFGASIDRGWSEVVLQELSGNRKHVAISGPSPPSTSAFAPDGSLLAVGYRDGSVKLCRVSTGEQLFHCPFRTAAIRQLAFSGDGATLAITDGEGVVQLLNLVTLRQGLIDDGLGW